MLVSLDTVRAELGELDLEVAQEIERDVTEGIYHSGIAATVQVVGKAH